MAFISGDINIDEDAAPTVGSNDGNEDDLLYTDWATAHPALNTHLNSLDHATGGDFPQVAERDDMIDFSTASGLALKIVSEGLPTDFTDIDGNAIALYTDSTNPNIILGIGEDDEVSFAVILDVVDSGSTITSAKVYVVQYEALYNTDPTKVDADDPLNLAGLISLEVTTTDFVQTFEPLNFSAIPSGSPQETLTVPTTSTTDNHSITFNGLIFPNGIVDDPTTVATNPGTDDDLNPDAVGFGVKGGQASQFNQNEGFFAQDSLWVSTSPDLNEISGLRFDIQGIGGVKSVNVEYWLVDNGEVVDGSHTTQTVQLPSGNAVYEDFTIQSATSFDQVYVRTTYDTKVATSGVRLENFETLVSSLTPVETTTAEDLGAHIIFQDDFCTLRGQFP